MNVEGKEHEEEDVDKKYSIDDRYRIKRRKCTNPFRRMRIAKKKNSDSANASDDSDDNEKRESKNKFFTFYIPT